MVDADVPMGQIIATALRAHTAIYSAHTNLDSAVKGINYVLADAIGLKDIRTLVSDDHQDLGEQAPVGLGRLGTLEKATSVRKFASHLKACLKLSHIRIAGDPDLEIRQVAVCSGSGSGLLDIFLNSDAQVYVSGDLRYHDARIVEEAGRALIDIGHFPSEHLMIDPLVRQLRKVIMESGWQVCVESCSLENDPFFVM